MKIGRLRLTDQVGKNRLASIPTTDLHMLIDLRRKTWSTTALGVKTEDGPPPTFFQVFCNGLFSVHDGIDFCIIRLV